MTTVTKDMLIPTKHAAYVRGTMDAQNTIPQVPVELTVEHLKEFVDAGTLEIVRLEAVNMLYMQFAIAGVKWVCQADCDDDGKQVGPIYGLSGCSKEDNYKILSDLVLAKVVRASWIAGASCDTGVAPVLIGAQAIKHETVEDWLRAPRNNTVPHA